MAAIPTKKDLRYWSTVIGAIVAVLVVVVTAFVNYHTGFASGNEVQRFKQDYQKFTKQQSKTNLRAERRGLERDISAIKYRAHGRQMSAGEIERVDEKKRQIKEITEDLKDKK